MKKAMGTITTWLNDFTDLLKALIVLGILMGILYNDVFGVIAGIGTLMNQIGDGSNYWVWKQAYDALWQNTRRKRD